ncbi:transposase [Pseudomonas sp. KNUC1026]|uniref:transposase n=1 Tax=Pseudomonas sp. KNUC1026 TaxID=2893890 RepID=UPI001F1BE929|nr:transposase [Pseudomonas sp. KNUC1026]UFH48583.1 transposase [Pseudomonas sp. KNUC1026]UFH49416.1 transposase [Pseudomonas sp. KNUC1026]UFH50291.1 transposase [Pseudomonas sp. KNUC1026]UFH50350.1 transposase [Pseudomonas sp. KNUC1026]
MQCQHRRRFSDAFKAQAVKRSIESAGTLTETAKELGIHLAVLSRWRTEYSRTGRIGAHTMAEKPEPPARSNADLERENKRLKREIERLKMETAILKKAEEYFAKRQQ